MLLNVDIDDPVGSDGDSDTSARIGLATSFYRGSEDGHGCTDSMEDHGCTVIKEGALDFEIHDMTTGVDVHMSTVATIRMTRVVLSVCLSLTIIIKMIRGSHFQEDSLVWDRGRSKKLIHMEAGSSTF